MSLPIPEIPETATEEYLEKLRGKIHKRLEGTSNKRIRERLYTLLETVVDRERQLRVEETSTLIHKDAREQASRPDGRSDESQLSEEQQQQVKERLRGILDAIKTQRLETPVEIPDDSSDIFFQEDKEDSSQILLDTAKLSDEEYALVKGRMSEISKDIQGFQPFSADESEDTVLDLGPEEELTSDNEGMIELGPESEVGEASEDMLDLGPELEVDIDIGTTIQLGPELEVGPGGGDQFESDHDEELWGREDQEFPSEAEQPISEEIPEDAGDLTFESVCRRVGKGESLVLFEKIGISPREQLLIDAFNEHLAQMKGVKRQQAFDMQHLTSRSIRELEQIFKTYHLQGYLRAELNNIYNRLLNLRSRFSILLH